MSRRFILVPPEDGSSESSDSELCMVPAAEIDHRLLEDSVVSTGMVECIYSR